MVEDDPETQENRGPQGHAEENAYAGAAEEDHAPLNTVTFTGRTILTLLVQCRTKEDRDSIINSGMEVGMQKAWDFLEQVAVSLI